MKECRADKNWAQRFKSWSYQKMILLYVVFLIQYSYKKIVFDCQLCCSLIRRFLFLVRLSCLFVLSFCPVFCLMSLFAQFWFVQCSIGQLVLPQIQLRSAQLSLTQVNSGQLSSAHLISAQLNSTQLSSYQLNYFFRPFSSSFDLSNLPLDSWYFSLFLFYSNLFCPMLDWTSQNWKKRDGRNN